MLNMAELVGTKVTVEALFREKLSTDWNFKFKILLGDVFVNGTYYRDHTFVKFSSRWDIAKTGDTIRFTAVVTSYMHKGKQKFGFRRVRNLEVFSGFAMGSQ